MRLTKNTDEDNEIEDAGVVASLDEMVSLELLIDENLSSAACLVAPSLGFQAQASCLGIEWTGRLAEPGWVGVVIMSIGAAGGGLE